MAGFGLWNREQPMMSPARLATAAFNDPGVDVDTADPAELLNYLKQIHVPVRDLRPTGAARRFRYRRTRIELGRCRMIRTDTSAYEMRTDEGGRIFAFSAVRGSRSIESASTRVTSQIGRPAIIVPYQEVRFDTPVDNSGLMVTLPIREVANEIGLAPPGQEWTQRSPLARELSRSSGAQFVRSFEFIWQQIASLRTVPPLLLAAYDEVILHCLFGLLCPLLSHVAPLPVADPGSPLIDRACDILRSEVDQPLRMASVAARLGVTPRHLQKGFRRYLSTTPQQFLSDCRLELARHRLLTARNGETVTSIALDCGFGHLGEFAVRYRQRFGERPSETLRGVVSSE
jgi:AraC-like DNA-binding protein